MFNSSILKNTTTTTITNSKNIDKPFLITFVCLISFLFILILTQFACQHKKCCQKKNKFVTIYGERYSLYNTNGYVI